jgi:hypothetical protein
VSLLTMSSFVTSSRAKTGRLPPDRLCLSTALLAKAVHNLTTTRPLIERLKSDTPFRRLCGWERAEQVPTESTFSRAFAEFATNELPRNLHAAIVRDTQKDCLIDYIARDSTAIEAREHLPEDKEKKEKAGLTERKRRGAKPGRHKRAKACERGTRLERQQHMTLAQMQADLPGACSLGVKTSSKGHQQYWRGYKLHWDVADSGRIPISCILTGANVHDSQVAIPLMRMSAERVRWLCDVMDRAYVAKLIRAESQKLGHEALIQPVKHKNGKVVEFTEEQKQRFKKRTIIEQLNGRLKDEFGGRIIYFRGASKIMTHLMFGVVALTVDQLLRHST